MKLIDGDGLVLGRAASRAAKMALLGERVVIVNAEKMIISGGRKYILEKYIKRRRVKNKANPEHSPKWPKRPDLLVKRIIRGMLPYKKAKGREAFKRIRVYMGPEEVKGAEKVDDPTLKPRKLRKYMTVADLSKALSYEVL